MQQQQQQCPLAAAPRKKMATPWWDFFSHCKEAAESDSEDDRFQNNDDMSYADFNNDGCVTNSANDDDDLTINSAPHSPASIVRTPLKIISTQSNDTADGDNYDAEAARPDTPATHDSSFETSSSSSSHHDDDEDDISSASSSSSSLQSIELNKEEQEDCNFIGEVTPGSLVSSPQASSSLKLVTTSSVVVMSPPKYDATPYNIKQKLLQLQSTSEEEDCEEQDDDDNDTITIANINSDDDYNFIGEIEIMPISPLLSTHQRNIRKNAYNLLKRLGEKESLFDVNSVEVVEEKDDEECDDYERQKRQKRQQELQEEVDDLKRQLGECIGMVLRLQDNLRSYSNGTTSSKEINEEDDDNKDDDQAEQLHAEIAELKRQLQSTTAQITEDAQQIQSFEAQLQHALHESSHHLDKMQEYEEKIDSLNEAVVRSSLYNEEIVKELMILRKENDDLRTRLVDDDKKREVETEADKNEFLSLEGEANASPSIAAAAGGAIDKASEASFRDCVVDGGDDDATTVCGHVPSVFHHYEQQPRSTLQDHPLSCTKQGATPTWFWPLAGSILICVSIINFRGNDVTILMNQAYIAAFHMGGVMYHNRLEHHPASGVGPGMFVILAFAVAYMRAPIWMVFGGLLVCYALAVGLTKVSVKPATAFDDGSGES